MTVNIPTYFTFNGQKFPGAAAVGFTQSGTFVVDAYTTPPPNPRGTFFTTIPISPSAFRKRNKKYCKVSVSNQPDRLIICDDWGHPHTIIAARDVLDLLVKEAKHHKITVTK